MKAIQPFSSRVLGVTGASDMGMAITLQNARGHLAVHTKGKKVLKKGSYFPDGLAVLLKVLCPGVVHSFVSFPLLAIPINSRKGEWSSTFFCIVVREPSSTC